MKNSNTFSILFWLKLANAKNGKAPPYVQKTVKVSHHQRIKVSIAIIIATPFIAWPEMIF
jgi:hypothetical protein